MTRPAPRRSTFRRAGLELVHDHPARNGPGWLPLGLAVIGALAAAGCDNPACVFSPTQCQPDEGGGGPGGIGTFSATFPNDVSWLAPSAPSVVRSAPSIIDAHPETPLIVEFDQSLDPASLGGAFEVLDTLTLTPVPLIDPPALVGDGRVVVLTVPTVTGQPSPLIAGNTYLVRFTDDQAISDVTGQAFDFGTGQDIFEFGVSDMPPTRPRVLYSYPADDAVVVSDLTEVVVVFDRKMNAATFSIDSFAVTANGTPPTPNPPPSSLILTGLQIPQPVLQVWIWKSADGNGVRQSLGADTSMRVRLSPMGNRLAAQGGQELEQTDIDFRTALVLAPTSIVKAPGALPEGAIGLPNLMAGEVLLVTFAAEPGTNDTLDIFIIGGSPANPQLLKAEQRSVTIPQSPGQVTFALTEAELDLREPNGAARFRDGEIEFMVRVRRGAAATAARRTDGSATDAGFQRIALDLTPPRLLGLGVAAESVTLVRSELGGIVIVGLGDEEIRFARVTTSQGNNYATSTERPAVALSSPGGRFIARPVMGAPDVLDPAGPAITYTVEVFDRALNAAVPPAMGTFQQVGAVGPGPSPVGGNVTVRVFDADTAAPLDGALVMSHSDDGSVLTDLGSAMTVGGIAVVPGAGIGATVVTVQRTGYDAFTFHGVPVERFDVPLPRAGVAPASISGVVQRSLTTDFITTVNWIGDNRALQPGLSLTPTASCGLSTTGQPECNYGPFPVRAQRLGLTTFFATNPSLMQSEHNGPLFLRGSALLLSDGPLGYGMNATGQDLAVSPAEGLPVATNGHTLSIVGLSGFGDVAGAPINTVEGFAPGLEGAPTLGIGNPYSTSPDTWTVLGAIPSIATAGGELVTSGAIELDLYFREEVVDLGGNRVGARPRFSANPVIVQPIDVPRLLTPASGASTGGDSYGIEVVDVMPDTLGMNGLYRVVVADSGGRRWHLWALDPPGSGTVRLALPPVVGLGGSQLADGQQMGRVSAWAWPDLDPTLFLWADVERRHEVFGHAATTVFTQD